MTSDFDGERLTRPFLPALPNCATASEARTRAGEIPNDAGSRRVRSRVAARLEARVKLNGAFWEKAAQRRRVAVLEARVLRILSGCLAIAVGIGCFLLAVVGLLGVP